MALGDNCCSVKATSGSSLIAQPLKDALANYLRWEQNEAHKMYIQELERENNMEELQRLLGKPLKFGTAGIRGPMGAGFSQINELTVTQISQGLVSYLMSLDCGVDVQRGVMIGHDARHNSDRFARLAALACVTKGIPVKFCQQIVPTPLIAFGVREYKCCAGIVITASHNPKNDNGYKVYNCKGSMFNSTHEAHIQKHISMAANQVPWRDCYRPELLLEKHSKLFELVDQELNAKYMNYLRRRLLGNRRSINEQSSLNITYTPMHGVGFKFFMEALGQVAGFRRLHPVELQCDPNPEFPTVRFPNPEEANALDLAFATAAETSSSLILANDPDADRCAVGLIEKTGEQRVLTGNEIGAILGWWAWMERPKGSLPESNYYMLASTVSSKFLHSMAKVEGFKFAETLTGFKHMTDLTQDLEAKGKRVVFAFEEALGYMVDTTVLDKDGISAALQVAQCAAYLEQSLSRSLAEQLDWLYLQYGYHYSLNSYYFCYDPEVVAKIRADIQREYPTSFGDFQVTRLRDLNNGYDSGTPDNRAELASSSSSFMVTFFIDTDITFTLRTSGTEPKIKYYSEIISSLEEGNVDLRKEKAQRRLAALVEAAVDRCLKPSVYNLKAAG